jgi:hypothetical protein
MEASELVSTKQYIHAMSTKHVSFIGIKTDSPQDIFVNVLFPALPDRFFATINPTILHAFNDVQSTAWFV